MTLHVKHYVCVCVCVCVLTTVMQYKNQRQYWAENQCATGAADKLCSVVAVSASSDNVNLPKLMINHRMWQLSRKRLAAFQKVHKAPQKREVWMQKMRGHKCLAEVCDSVWSFSIAIPNAEPFKRDIVPTMLNFVCLQTETPAKVRRSLFTHRMVFIIGDSQHHQTFCMVSGGVLLTKTTRNGWWRRCTSLDPLVAVLWVRYILFRSTDRRRTRQFDWL